MPTYAYACKDCGHAFDIQQSFSDDSLTVCPACSGVLRKKFSSVGVVFKGSGFYRNDSRDAKSSVEPVGKPAAAADAGAGKTDGAKDKQGAASAPAAGQAKPAKSPATRAAAGSGSSSSSPASTGRAAS